MLHNNVIEIRVVVIDECLYFYAYDYVGIDEPQ
jgi:hypothetical protein